MTAFNNFENGSIVYNAGRAQWFWFADNNDSMHPTVEITLDHDINGDELALAWEKTKRVYPLLDCVPVLQPNKDIVFIKQEGNNIPIESRIHVKPCSKLTFGRAVAVSYYEKVLTVTAYHAVVDGHGLMDISRNLCFNYLAIHTGNSDEGYEIRNEESAEVESYYKPESTIHIGDYSPQPLVMLPLGESMLVDGSMSRKAGEEDRAAKIRVPVADFIGLCKKNKTNPSSMFSYIMGKAIYLVNPAQKDPIALSVTVDYRRTFRTEQSVAPCSADAMVVVKHDDIMVKPMEQTVGKIRSMINIQRSDDYIKTVTAMTRALVCFRKNVCAVVSYIGQFDVGSNTKHVEDFCIYNIAANTMFITELADEFRIMLKLGSATEKYTHAMKEILKELGIKSEVYADTYEIYPEADSIAASGGEAGIKKS